MDQSQHNHHDDKRQARVREYLEDALEDPDALQANIAATQADLFDLSRRLKIGIDRALDEGATVNEVAPTVTMLLNLDRQVVRFLPFDRRFRTD